MTSIDRDLSLSSRRYQSLRYMNCHGAGHRRLDGDCWPDAALR